MYEFEDLNVISCFMTVGALRELLKNYPDETPINVCGTHGLFCPNNEHHYILLETLDNGEWDDMPEIDLPSNAWQEYMDF